MLRKGAPGGEAEGGGDRRGGGWGSGATISKIISRLTTVKNDGPPAALPKSRSPMQSTEFDRQGSVLTTHVGDGVQERSGRISSYMGRAGFANKGATAKVGRGSSTDSVGVAQQPRWVPHHKKYGGSFCRVSSPDGAVLLRQ